MKPVTRREALTLGGVGVAAIAAGSAGLIWMSGASDAPTVSSGGDFREPVRLVSEGGSLSVTLTASPHTTSIAGTTAHVLAYNDGLPGPTLVVNPGDTLTVTLENKLDQPTNLHVHGMHVSPRGSSDNVFVAIEPGQSFRYEYQLPRNHPPGVYWYHPHHHGMVADQVFAGLYGAIIVEDAEGIRVDRERVLVVSDITIDSAGDVPQATAMETMAGREGAVVLVNGVLAPKIAVRPGQRERWRVVNACVSRYLELQMDGAAVHVLGIDLGREVDPPVMGTVILAPGNRADLLVDAQSANSVLRSLAVDRGSAGMMQGRSVAGRTVDLLAVDVVGTPVPARAPIARRSGLQDLRRSPINARRTLTLSMTMGMGGMGGTSSDGGFLINGLSFDPTRLDMNVAMGSVEEWTLVNASPMDHPFHLHVWPMQVTETGGSREDRAVWRDVVNVPANQSVVVRIAFEDFDGTTVYHCHILDHEDRGMMGTIRAA